MRERPILFGGEMVRAILDGRKTQTRRPVKPQPRVGGDYARCTVCDKSKGPRGRSVPMATVNSYCDWDCPGYRLDPQPDHLWPGESEPEFGYGYEPVCPFGVPGDRLWVRETWSACRHGEKHKNCIEYRADGDPDELKWRPSIHMPRWASRITLEITDVRVERVQEISEEDVFQEGHPTRPKMPYDVSVDAAKDWFMDLWDSIYSAKGLGWDANPWVWVVGFRRVTP